MSDDACYALLDGRGVLSVAGPDRVDFLQGLVSNDMRKVTPDRAVYAALLTPQGKYLHDFFVVAAEDALLLDCERDRQEDLQKRLAVYKLRADVALKDRSDALAVAAVFGAGGPGVLGLAEDAGAATAFAGGVACVDPRLGEAGARVLLPRTDAKAALEAAGLVPAEAAAYDRLRLGLGLPDGSRDLTTEKSTLLESGFDELNGVDWDKGCYMGQELTARTRYRGLVKKRLVPVVMDGPPPKTGTPVMLEGRAAGELRSSLASGGGGIGLALLTLESMAEAAEKGARFDAGGVALRPEKPDWAAF